MKGANNHYTTEFRQYDPRIGRWMSLDPLMDMFPDVSAYCAFDNNPIYYSDPYGLAPEGGDEGWNEGDVCTDEAGAERMYKGNGEWGDPNVKSMFLELGGIINDAIVYLNSEAFVEALESIPPRDPIVVNYYKTPDELTDKDYSKWNFQPGDKIHQYIDAGLAPAPAGDYQEFTYLGNKEWILTDDFDGVKMAYFLYEVTITVLPAPRVLKGVHWIYRVFSRTKNIIVKIPLVKKTGSLFKRVGSLFKGVNLSKGMVKFSEKAEAAANRLGFYSSEVAIKNSVAEVPIWWSTKFDPADVKIVLDALKSNGAKKVIINSGPIQNQKLGVFLNKLYEAGRSYQGFNITKTGNPDNMFILTKKL